MSLATTIRLLSSKILPVLILWLGTQAQIFAQVDTEFWFVAPEVSVLHGDEPNLLRISTLDQAASVTISQPANTAFSPIFINIPANETTTINLTSRKALIENQPADLVLDKGIKITASAPITAYYEVASPVNPEIFSLKGRNALGQSFYIPSQNTFRNEVGSEAFDIVATENNTEIRITPAINIVGHPAGLEFVITLQAGETYSARAIATNATASLAGSRVTSNRPIAITVNDDSIYLQVGAQAGWDLIGDQIVPTNLLGTEHIVTEGFSGIGENVYILAVEDNTDLFIAGSLVATLSAGETYRHDISAQNTFIESSEPVYVWHVSGHPIELGSALIPHINCTGTQRMNFIRSNSDDFALILLTKNGNQGNFTFNGTSGLINASDFEVVPNTGNEWVAMIQEFSTAEIPINQAHILENSTGLFHLGILNKLGQSSEYGYFSDFTSVNLGDDIQSCLNEVVLLDAGVGRDSYLWSNGATSQTISVTTAGEYWVEITKGDCSTRDTIQVDFLPVPELSFGDFPQELCFNGVPVTPIANANNPGIGFFQINGETITEIHPALLGAGTYDLQYIFENTNNCSDTISTSLTVYADNNLAFVDLEDNYCNDAPPITLSATPSGGVFRLNGSTENISAINPALLEPGLQEVSYIYTHPFTACVDTLSQNISILPVPEPAFINLPINFCSGDEAFPLAANPTGGTFQINGNPSTEINPSQLEVGLHEVAYTYSNGSCEKTISQQISINPTPTVTLTNLAEGYCQADAPFLVEVSPSGGILQLDGVNTGNPINPAALSVGNHVLSYAYTNAAGCTQEIAQSFEIASKPRPVFSPNPQDSIFICPSSRTGITLSAEGGKSVSWSTGEASNSINVKQGGTYTVRLSNGFGCEVIQVFEVYEKCEPAFALPNAFSPNGDGLNDVFRIIGGDLYKLDFKIFNRWGEVVFYTYREEEAWDGTLNGKPAPAGVYIWTATYENILDPTKTVYRKSGKVSLIR